MTVNQKVGHVVGKPLNSLKTLYGENKDYKKKKNKTNANIK